MAVLAFTCGDPAGIGPRIAAAASRDPRVLRACRPVLIGSKAAFRREGFSSGGTPFIDIGPCGKVPVGRASAEGGRISYLSLLKAVELCGRGLAQGIVTAPICKESWRMAGVPYPDHTAALKGLAGVPRVAMMLIAGSLRAVLATRHIPLMQVGRSLDIRVVREAALLAREALREHAGIPRPRLGLCALNPHGGENGLLGSEEGRLLGPIVRTLRREGIRLEGPLPADTAWSAHARGDFDALVALYHDQALIPLKLAARYGAINWTLGLPFARVSPMHGTAFDAARRGQADSSGMVEAALWAARAARTRRA
ncbi:MAG: 4-hydroxythreonine-4-phosphate dehydrogenase PdxA [Elusimicrobiota bacterium]